MIAGRTAIYARVSSEAQARENTIASQLASLRERVAADGLWLEPADCFVDEGYSGAILVRPALEQLRDAAASGRIERLYVHAPDRLARRYAHQALLIDELRRAGVEIVFLNRPIGDTPEDDLLLQVQGVIAEYERAKILERGRRGRRHAARSGSVCALTGAPFGYRYVSRSEGGGVARFDVVEEEARIVRLIFAWVGRERLSLREACRRLQEMNCRTRRGSPQWHASTLRGMLINPAYTGHAAFGRFHYLPPRPKLRAQRGHSKPSSHPVSRVPASLEEWIDIPVVAIVDDATFEAVHAQLAENKQRKRDRETGHVWLLQGLTVCRRCGYAYYGKSAPRTREYDPTNLLRYYRCTGADGHKFQGQALCCNPPVRADQLEGVVWDRVKAILQEPERVADEYKRRIAQAAAGAEEPEEVARLEKQMAGVRRGIERLIDSYAGGFVEKGEFEPRITGMKQRMSQLKERCQAAVQTAEHDRDIRLVVSRLEDFAAKVSDGLDSLDRAGQREIIRAMVKRIDLEQGELEIVFRVPPPHVPSDPDPSARGKGTRSWQHCTAVRRTLHRLVESMPPFGQGLGNSHPQRPHFPPPRLNPPHAPKTNSA